MSLWPACHSYPTPCCCCWHTPHHQVVPVACTFVEIQQCQLCNTKATMPSSFCLTVEAKAALQARLLLLLLLQHLLLFPVVLCRTKIARFSLSLFVMPLPIPLHPPPRTRLDPLFTCFWLLFYVRNLHWPLCRRLLHFCFFCTAKRWKTQRRKTKRKRGRERERVGWG